MGTRNLILVYYKGEYRIAQYGQWDGYPQGQSVTVLTFISDPTNLDKLKAALDTPDKVYVPTQEQLEQYQEEEMTRVPEHAKQGSLMVWPPPAKGEPIYPSLSRDTSAKILGLVANATEPIPIVKEVEFIADTLFCEWAYVVDMDADVFEVYSGLLGGYVQDRLGEKEGVREGGGPNLIAEWDLKALPNEPEFLKACTERNESKDDVEDGEEPSEEEAAPSAA